MIFQHILFLNLFLYKSILCDIKAKVTRGFNKDILKPTNCSNICPWYSTSGCHQVLQECCGSCVCTNGSSLITGSTKHSIECLNNVAKRYGCQYTFQSRVDSREIKRLNIMTETNFIFIGKITTVDGRIMKSCQIKKDETFYWGFSQWFPLFTDGRNATQLKLRTLDNKAIIFIDQEKAKRQLYEGKLINLTIQCLSKSNLQLPKSCLMFKTLGSLETHIPLKPTQVIKASKPSNHSLPKSSDKTLTIIISMVVVMLLIIVVATLMLCYWENVKRFANNFRNTSKDSHEYQQPNSVLLEVQNGSNNGDNQMELPPSYLNVCNDETTSGRFNKNIIINTVIDQFNKRILQRNNTSVQRSVATDNDKKSDVSLSYSQIKESNTMELDCHESLDTSKQLDISLLYAKVDKNKKKSTDEKSSDSAYDEMNSIPPPSYINMNGLQKNLDPNDTEVVSSDTNGIVDRPFPEYSVVKKKKTTQSSDCDEETENERTNLLMKENNSEEGNRNNSSSTKNLTGIKVNTENVENNYFEHE